MKGYIICECSSYPLHAPTIRRVYKAEQNVCHCAKSLIALKMRICQVKAAFPPHRLPSDAMR